MRAMLGVIGPDLSAPAVSITSPADLAKVTRTISVQAHATDDRGVAGVQWQVDGVNVGAEVTSGDPWAFSLDTSAYGDGNHTLTAVARDAVGHHTTSAPITLNVANPDTSAIHNFHVFNGVGAGARRAYGSVGSFASPNYQDGSAGAWVGNAYSAWGYVLQVRLVTSVDSHLHGYEDINGVPGDHATGISIGGAQYGATLVDTVSASAWVTISNAAAGTVNLNDWLNNAAGIGGTAYTGDITLQYRYQ